MNNATDSDSDLRLAIQPYHHHYDVVPIHSVAAAAAAATSAQLVPVPAATSNNNNPKKKRTKPAGPDPNPEYPSRVAPVTKREKKPEITMPCSECGKRFWSWKALFGHMRCHPERQWRGINPPLNLLRDRRSGGGGSLSPPPRPAASVSDDENDVAACLLLLANAGGSRPSDQSFVDPADVERFECSSCKKVFGSHQALGGHRASHKNVKGCFAIAAEDHAGEKLIAAVASPESLFGFHRCGICLRTFSSGQALGGHKRCHWEKGGFNCDGVGQPSTSGALDLNFPPAMEEDDKHRHHCSYSSTSNNSSALADLDLRLGF